jgi:hypothetical protein
MSITIQISRKMACHAGKNPIKTKYHLSDFNDYHMTPGHRIPYCDMAITCAFYGYSRHPLIMNDF